jgi:hypothetical protein
LLTLPNRVVGETVMPVHVSPPPKLTHDVEVRIEP